MAHETRNWGIEAETGRGGCLHVRRYHLGTLPVKQRMIEAEQLTRQRLQMRSVFERRVAELSAYLEQAALERGCHKASLLVRLEEVPYFIAAGLSVEAMVDGYYEGLSDAAWMSLHLGATTGSATEEASTDPFFVTTHPDALAVELLCEGELGNLTDDVLRAEEIRLAQEGFRTLMLLTPTMAAHEPDALRAEGYHFRGTLAGHRVGPDGPEDLDVWVRSLNDLVDSAQKEFGAALRN